MPDNGGAPAAEHIVEFGSPDWSLYLGGDYAGIEQAGGISWNWAGANRVWCILPAVEAHRDYMLRLHAAPFAPFQTDLRELVVAADANILKRRVVAAREPVVQTSFDSPGGKLALLWRAMPLPQLEVHLNETAVARFEYEQRPDLQMRECLLRREFFLTERNVLFFTPNFAVSPEELGTPGDSRRLSFRLFRAVLTPLD